MTSIRELTLAAIVMAIYGATAPCAGAAAAQGANLNAIHLSDDIVPAPDGFEAVTEKYVTRKATDLYIGPFIWAGKVIGMHLGAGQPVEILAKLKGYDWFLVGSRGEGIGYVPMSVLIPAK